jgi:hypothetical protein
MASKTLIKKAAFETPALHIAFHAADLSVAIVKKLQKHEL